MKRIAAFCLWLCTFPVQAATHPFFLLPQTALGPLSLAVVVNDDDPLSRQIGDYYQAHRHIPAENVIHVHFAPGRAILPADEFMHIKTQVDAQATAQVQAYAITWAVPYRVDCMSITAAFTFGFDQAYCSSRLCAPTRASPYFNSPVATPFTDLKMRPTMALAGRNFKEVKALIDRGIAADGTHPRGTGYLLSTSDQQRNVRAAYFPELAKKTRGLVDMKFVKADFIRDKKDVLFYFTGAVNVPALDTLHFRPGAMADHLTSTGGQLTDSAQMSSLRWLEAGATGSYGSVVEPCNLPAKFPNPALAVYWYLQGNSLLEAYWKSVQWPGEGIFIGEPLSTPYGGIGVTVNEREIVMHTQALPPGTYALQGAGSMVGPYKQEAGTAVVHLGMNELHFSNSGLPYYRLMRLQ